MLPVDNSESTAMYERKEETNIPYSFYTPKHSLHTVVCAVAHTQNFWKTNCVGNEKKIYHLSPELYFMDKRQENMYCTPKTDFYHILNVFKCYKCGSLCTVWIGNNFKAVFHTSIFNDRETYDLHHLASTLHTSLP